MQSMSPMAGSALSADTLARCASIAAMVARRTSVTSSRVAVEHKGLARSPFRRKRRAELADRRFSRSGCFLSVSSSIASIFDSATISAFSASPSP